MAAAVSSPSPIGARQALSVALVGLAVAAALIFTGLGEYPFWGDEADTVIFARGVWETGDTTAWYGENSDVLPEAVVAVAVTTCPAASGVAGVNLNFARPAASVVTCCCN